ANLFQPAAPPLRHGKLCTSSRDRLRKSRHHRYFGVVAVSQGIPRSCVTLAQSWWCRALAGRASGVAPASRKLDELVRDRRTLLDSAPAPLVPRAAVPISCSTAGLRSWAFTSASTRGSRRGVSSHSSRRGAGHRD